MKVHILDYKLGNTGSLVTLISQLGYTPVLTNDPDEIKESFRLVIPGVGAYGDAIQNLKNLGLYELLKDYRNWKKDGARMLGICIGMHVLSTKGFEFGEHEGLNLIEGSVLKIESSGNHKVPHVGWNDICQSKSSSILFKEIDDNSDFYFVHSYHFLADSEDHVTSKVEHASMLVSTIEKDSVFGTQFHPEKSSKIGRKLIQNFIEG